MVENKSSLFGIIALIIGASGLGLGAFSVVTFQVVEGPQGPPGQDTPGEIQVGILDPDYGEEVLGKITIRALIAGSESYFISILRNGTQIGTSLPFEWDTSAISDGWWNITVIATDALTKNVSSDEVIVYVKNMREGYICSSEQEINDVLDAIGTGTVVITTINTIVLTSPIVLDEGGNYTIKGVNSLIVCGTDFAAFEITNISSCNIYDLNVDVSAITSDNGHIIHINDVNDNPVHIENVLIFGDSDKKGYGIYIQSNNVLIRNCIFSFLNRGIHLYYSSYTNIHNSDFNNNNWGIYNFYGDYNIIRGNYIEYGIGGIFIRGYHNIINNNVIKHVSYTAIENDEGYHTLISENLLDGSSVGGNIGIYLYGHMFDYSIVIYRNVICNWDYGILIDRVDWVSIVNNTFIRSASYHIMWAESFYIFITGNTYFAPPNLFP